MVRTIVQSLKILTIAVTALLVATGGLRFFDLAVDRSTPPDVGARVQIKVGQDDDANAVAKKLADAGLIRSKLLFTGQMTLTQSAPKEGSYTLRKGMTVPQIIDQISGKAPAEAAQAADQPAGSNGTGQTVKVTIPEGWRTEQIAEEAAKTGLKGGAAAFMKATRSVDRSKYEFLADLPQDSSLEGYLFPDTYDFVADDPAYDVELMLDNFDAKFTPDMRDRAKQMNLTIPEVLSLAALIEREAKLDEERPIIADVYLNRLQDGWKMEADPTVQYAVGKPGDWWPTKLTDAQLHTDNPYNTYQHDGLPPGPICNPGLASIQAVLFPGGTQNFFFVATGDESGSHAFAQTKEEQDANVEKYKQALAGG